MKDLHIHTIYSDGELTPQEIINIAKEKKIDLLSITDHDTIFGNKEVIDNNLHKKLDINFITGIELSAKIDKGNCHILGYNIDIYNKKLSEKLELLNDMNCYNISLVINYLKEKFGIILNEKQLNKIFNKLGSINNVAVSQSLVEMGYVKSIKEAFNKYILEARRATKKERKEFTPYECIDIIKNADGIPVLAHNYQLKKDDDELKKYLIDLKNHGLIGLECYHSGFTTNGTQNSLKLAHELDFLITGGSDYHGPNIKPDIEIGSGQNNNIEIEQLSIEKYLTKKLKY